MGLGFGVRYPDMTTMAWCNGWCTAVKVTNGCMQQVMHQWMAPVTVLTTGLLQPQMTDCGQEQDMHQDMQIRLTLDDWKALDSCWHCNFWFIAVITATCHLTNLTNWSKVCISVTTKAWHPEHQNCWTSRCKLLPCLSVMIVTCAAKSKTASLNCRMHCLFQLHHIKGHQDQTPIMSADGTPQPLSWQVELNIKCDHGACMAATGNLWQNSTEQQSPMFPAAWVHLLIQGKIVTWQTKEWLQGAATAQDCREHLCTKFKWDDNACDAVNWSSMHLALKWFQKANQWQLQKWIHDWLPLNAFLHKQKPHHCATCPTCNEMAEDHWHFLKCKHPTWHQIFTTLWSTSADFCTKSKAGDDLFALPWDGIQTIWQNKAMHPQEVHAKHLHELHQSQSSIGWDQLFHGWFSQLWGTIFETAGAPTEEIDVTTGGTQWIAELTMTTWQHVLLLWDSQNGDQHSHAQAKKEWKECDKLMPQMQGACSIKNQLPEAAQQQPHRTSLTELLQQLLQTLWHWVHIAQPCIKAQLQAAKMQKWLGINDIRQYFKIKNWPRGLPHSNNTTKRPPQSTAACGQCELQCVQWDRNALSWQHSQIEVCCQTKKICRRQQMAALQTVCFFSFIFRALPRKHATAGNNTFMFLSLSVQSNNGKLHERSCKVKAKEPLFVEWFACHMLALLLSCSLHASVQCSSQNCEEIFLLVLGKCL